MSSSIATEETTVTTRPRRESGQKQSQSKPGQSLFRVIWRWHFYAGVLVSPLIMVVAATGAIYLFGAEIDDVANRKILFVDNVDSAAPAQALITSAEAALPHGQATKIKWHADPWRTAEVTVKPPPEEGEEEGGEPRRGSGKSVYVDPYTAETVAIPEGPSELSGFFRVVLKIHRQLFIGTTGRIIVELATCWTIILFLSGVYLWWPRRKEKVRGVWVPRWSGKSYVLLRDLHALMGVYLMPVCLTIMITGLFYTLVWGESFHFVTKPMFDQSPTAEAGPAEDDKPDSSSEKSDGQHFQPPKVALQQAVDQVRERYPNRDVTVTLLSKPDDHYEFATINDYARGTYGAMNSTGFKLHRDTAEIFEVTDLAENERYWWHTWAYPLHVGSIFGMPTKIIWLIACLLLIAMPFTGLWMWWKRRPLGRTGFPRRQSLRVVPVWIWGTIVALCWLMPVFGLSVLLVALGEWLYSLKSRRRLKPA